MAKRRTSPPAAAVKGNTPAPENWSIFRSISWWALLAVVFITPLAMSNLTFLGFSLPLTYDQFDIAKLFFQRVLGLIALGAWVWDVALRGGKIRRTPVDWLVLVFLAWVTVSAVFSIHPPTAIFGKYRRFEGLLSFINYAVLYFLTLQFADRPSRVKRLAQSLFFSGVVVAGYGVLQSLGADFVNWGQLPFEVNRAFSTFGNPDLLGGFLMFSTFISIALALAEEKLGWRIVYWVGFLLNMWCIVVAFTRSAWIGSVVGLALIVLFAVYQRVSWKAVDWSFTGAIGALLGVVVVRSLSSTNEVMNFGKRLASILEFGEGSALTRFEIWEAAWNATKARPIFGFGADTFRLVFPGYKPIEYTRDAGYLSVADNVHDYPLQLMAGIGIPGMLLLYGVFAWAAIRSFPIVFSRDGGPNRMILAGFWTACAAYITHLFFGLSVTGSSFLLWISMAVVLAPTASSFELKRPSWGMVAGAIVTALVLAGVIFQITFTMADNAYLKSRIASQGPERTEFANRAVALNPYNDIYRAEVGLAYVDEFIAALNEASQSQDPAAALQRAQTAFTQAETSLLETISFVPAEYDNYVFLSNVYNIAGQTIDKSYYEKSVEIALRGVEVEPYGPAIRLQLARALSQSGKPAEAIKHLEYAIKLDPAYADPVISLAQIYESQGDTDAALKVLKDAIARNANLAGVADEIRRIESSATTTP